MIGLRRNTNSDKRRSKYCNYREFKTECNTRRKSTETTAGIGLYWRLFNCVHYYIHNPAGYTRDGEEDSSKDGPVFDKLLFKACLTTPSPTLCLGLSTDWLSSLWLPALRLSSLWLPSLRLPTLRLSALRLAALRLPALRLAALWLSALRLSTLSVTVVRTTFS